uniref:Uncharacterized protein n=1 Tax=Fagus sylvatica TaxID=28930 RepID=A0A2N9EUM6_FAGSY
MASSSFVDGSESCPSKYQLDEHQKETTILNPAFVTWNKKDQCVISLINATLSESVLGTLYGLKTAHQAWTALAARMASHSRSRVTHLKRQLQNLKQGSKSCLEYIQGAKHMADQLSAVGKPVDDEDLISYIFADSGANTHITSAMKKLSLQQQYQGNEAFVVGNGAFLQIFGTGFIDGTHPAPRGYRCLDPSTSHIYISRNVVFDETSFPAKDMVPHSSDQVSASPISLAPFLHNLGYSVANNNCAGSSPSSTTSSCPSTCDMVPMDLNMTPPISLVTSTSSSLIESSVPTPIMEPPSLSPLLVTPDPPPSVDLPLTTQPPLPPAATPSTTASSSSSIVTRSQTGSLRPPMKHQDWRVAMGAEFDALLANHTWTLCPRLLHKNVIRNKWVYKLKQYFDGSIERYKARLVAKGFDQRDGIDYFETFSPVIKPTTLRLVLAIAISRAWPVRQLDISNAFLHGVLDEEVFMEQPQGFIDKTKPDHVCRLQKAIYGLKQAPRAWFTRLSHALISLGFTESVVDHSLFIFHRDATLIYFLVTLALLPFFLAFMLYEITLNCIFISLRGDPLPDATEYRHVVGALQYCTLTRLDIAYPVLLIMVLSSPKRNLHLQAFCGFDWASNPDDRHSTTGFGVFFGSCLISWSAKKQAVVSRSSTEAEYRAMALATVDLYWLRMLLKDLCITLPSPPTLWCDNVGALALATNPVFHARTKHIEIDYRFVREKVVNNDISTRYIATIDQVANIFTKPLGHARYLLLRDKLYVVPTTYLLEGGCKR